MLSKHHQKVLHSANFWNDVVWVKSSQPFRIKLPPKREIKSGGKVFVLHSRSRFCFILCSEWKVFHLLWNMGNDFFELLKVSMHISNYTFSKAQSIVWCCNFLLQLFQNFFSKFSRHLKTNRKFRNVKSKPNAFPLKLCSIKSLLSWIANSTMADVGFFNLQLHFKKQA